MVNLSLNAFLLIAAVSQPFLPVDASANTRFFHEAIATETASLSLKPENLGDDYSTEDKVNMINLTVLGLELMAGAVTWWNYEDDLQAFHLNDSDGWFGQDDPWGGADKLGHLFAGYAVTRGLSSLYRSAGMDESEARWYGAIAGMAIVSLIDVGDAFSKYGFSVQDIVANGVGSGLGYLLESYPSLDRLIDFRLEYAPTAELIKGEMDFDPVQDYSGMKFHLVLKASGIPALDNNFLRYLELHAGYYTRNYGADKGEPRERHLFYGISVNLSELINGINHSEKERNRSVSPVATFFRYYQVPGITVGYDRTLD